MWLIAPAPAIDNEEIERDNEPTDNKVANR